MDDNKITQEENQPESKTGQDEPAPIFETVAEEETPSMPKAEELQPEEIAPEIISTEEAATSSPPEIPPDESPPVYEENKNKYIIIGVGTVIFFLIFILLIRFFLGRGNAPKKEVKLTYWGLWEEKEIFEPLINQYQSINKYVKIDYQKMTPQDYREKLIVRSKDGQGPDIFRFHNTWLAQIKEIVAPLPSSVMENGEFEKTFYPIHQKDLKIGKYYYGMPLALDGLVLICNDSLFKKAGINNFPTNWDEVIDSISKLTVKDKNGLLVTSGIALGMASNVEHFSDIFGFMLIQNGGDLKKLDKPEAAQALEAYRKFAEPPVSFWDETMPNSIAAFTQEKVAMIIAPTWEIFDIKNANPEIKIKVVSLPVVPGGRSFSVASYWVEGVSRFSRNQIEGWKFLKFLVEKENLTKLYEIQSKTRLFGEPYSRVDLASVIVQNEYVGPIIKQAENLVSLPTIARTFDNGLNDEINKYLENAINATIQGVSYEEALKTAKQGVDQIFARYKIE